MSATATVKKLREEVQQVTEGRKDRRNSFRICTSIRGQNVREVAKKVATASRLGSDLVELRLDYLSQGIFTNSENNRDGSSSEMNRLASLIRGSTIPLIATVRKKEEGGNFSGTEKERVFFLKRIGCFHPDYIDVELSTIREHPELLDDLSNSQVIVSFHDLKSTPPASRIIHLFEEIIGDGRCSISKVVTYARRFEDNNVVLGLYEIMINKHHTRDSSPKNHSLVAFCSGEAGITSRILCLLLGSPFTYTSLPGERVAEGQLSIQEVRETLGLLGKKKGV
jgi:3-dehydroquinate dehydratase type I